MAKNNCALRVFLAVWTAITTTAAAPPIVNPSKAGMNAERLARIPERMKAFCEKGVIPGAVTLVARHGSIASLEAVGYQDLETGRPMRADTMFEIASMTKPVTAVGIMILMERGVLALTDPVEKFLPEFRGGWVIESRDGDRLRLKRPSRPITIRDLLTHTSGMYGDGGQPPVLKDMQVWLHGTLAQAVAIGSQQPLNFDPGTKWQYSSIAFATLGRIIEVASGQPYEKFIEAQIFQPLGMKDSHFFPPPEKHERIAWVYTLTEGKLRLIGEQWIGSPRWRYRKGFRNPVPEGGLYSTALDLVAFYQMMLNHGGYNGQRILSRAAVELMTSVQTDDLALPPGAAWGLGWSVARNPRGSVSLSSVSVGTFSHGGAYGTHGWVDPKNDLVGVFLVQRPGADEERNAFMSLVASAIDD